MTTTNRNDTTIFEPTMLQIMHFLDHTPPARLSRNLRNLLLQYLTLQKDGHTFDFDDLLTDLINLFELLDFMERGRDIEK